MFRLVFLAVSFSLVAVDSASSTIDSLERELAIYELSFAKKASRVFEDSEPGSPSRAALLACIAAAESNFQILKLSSMSADEDRRQALMIVSSVLKKQSDSIALLSASVKSGNHVVSVVLDDHSDRMAEFSVKFSDHASRLEGSVSSMKNEDVLRDILVVRRRMELRESPEVR